MERQKNREGHRESERQRRNGVAERQRRTWKGRKTEKDMERQKNRKSWSGRKT